MFPSQQSAPAPQPTAQPQQAAPSVSSDQLHQLALGAEKNLEQLATAMAHAGADPAATIAVGKMADVMRKILAQMAGPTPQGQPPAPQQHTMASATDALHAQLMAQQQGQ